MKCPKCEHKTRVIDVTNNVDANEIYRRRKCPGCGHTFYTTEFEVDDDKQFKKTIAKYHRDYVRNREKSKSKNI